MFSTITSLYSKISTVYNSYSNICCVNDDSDELFITINSLNSISSDENTINNYNFKTMPIKLLHYTSNDENTKNNHIFKTIPNNLSEFLDIPIIKNVNLRLSEGLPYDNRVVFMNTLLDSKSFFCKWLKNNINNEIKFEIINIDGISIINGSVEFLFIHLIYSLPNIDCKLNKTIILKNYHNTVLFIIKNNNNMYFSNIFDENYTKYHIFLQVYYNIAKSSFNIDFPSSYNNNDIIPLHIQKLMYKYSNKPINTIYLNGLTSIPSDQFIFVDVYQESCINYTHNLFIYVLEMDIKHVYQHINTLNNEHYDSFYNMIIIKQLNNSTIHQINNHKLNIIYEKIKYLL